MPNQRPSWLGVARLILREPDLREFTGLSLAWTGCTVAIFHVIGSASGQLQVLTFVVMGIMLSHLHRQIGVATEQLRRRRNQIDLEIALREEKIRDLDYDL